MMYVIPDYICEEIDRKLDEEIKKNPDAEKDRQILREQLIEYVNQHGIIPEFSLQPI